MTTTDIQERTRRLSNAVGTRGRRRLLRPESHAAYKALGFDGSPAHQGGVDRPNMTAHFTSRGACMGQVTGAVVAAAFGCFNPLVAASAVDVGWKITDRAAILDARERGATDILRRVLKREAHADWVKMPSTTPGKVHA